VSRRPLLALALTALLALAGTARAQSQTGMPEDAESPDVQEQLRALAAEKAAAAAKVPGTVETTKLAPPILQAGPVDPATYIVGPGDGLEVNLWGRLARTITLDVSPEGRIFLPGRSAIDVTGHTLAWTRQQILKVLSDQYVDVRADVRLTRLRTFKVYLSGDVKVRGPIEVNSATRASEPIAAVGLLDHASRRNVEVHHADGTVDRLDLDRIELVGLQDHNPLLRDGDVIVVPSALRFAEIAGAVAHSGRYELAPGDSIHTLVLLAGGLLPSASPGRTLMVRFTSAVDRESLLVDLDDPAASRPLRDGDRLFVQFRPEYHELPSVGITGEVERPGTYPIVPGRDRLSDLIRWAGGFRPTANRASIRLTRDTPASEERDPELDRLARLSRNEMTVSEYTKLETKLAERSNSFRVDWNQVQPGSATDPLLQRRDVVQVDRFVPTVRIEGQVKRPGYVDYAPGRALGDYIQLAGGFTERSARTSIRVSRAVTGQIIPARSLKAVLPGDFIWVPERRDVDAWSAFRDIVTVGGQVALIIFTLSRR
jgi:polysaccharide biosynthesis/export protein